MQPYQGNVNSIEPIPYNATTISAPGGDLGALNPLPYAAAPLGVNMEPGGVGPIANANSLAPLNVPAPNSYQQNSIEPLPYHNQTIGLQQPAPLTKRETTGGSVFSLRKFCSEDFEMSSAEGQQLMEQLNQEVDDLIRRKSYGLIQIDTTHAFEDLVFEEDSMTAKEPKESPPRTKQNRASSSSSSNGRGSGMSSGLSFKDDMSLMNMSILTLDEKDEGEHTSPIEEPRIKEESGTTPKSIIKTSDILLKKERGIMRNKGTRVSFAGKNISLSGMDDRSFSQLIDSISDGGSDAAPERSGSDMSHESSHSISRKVGFPMRKTYAQKLGATEDFPSEVGKELMEGRQDKISCLTIGEDAAMKSEGDFSRMAGKVENPLGVENSLKVDNMSAMNMSAFNMSISSDFEELLK